MADAGDIRPGRLPDALGRRYLLEFDTDDLKQHRADVLVVGSGIAGLTAALAASPGRTVDLVTKGTVSETNTWYAQGGIAGPVGETDSVELHVADTIEVGQGLCEPAVVRAVVEDAPEALAALRRYGVAFDLAEDGGGPALAREGGHSLPRVLHAGDATGAEIQNKLSHVVRRLENADIHEERFLVDLLTAGDRCVGALVLDARSRELEVFWADAVILATGGCGQLYRVTTNPVVATGDGVAAAWRAGAEVSDLEFVQFHPTALDARSDPKPLVTEALRGEGAFLLDADMHRFMVGVHPLAELAPRDVVTREIQSVMARTGRTNVWLDARHIGAERLRSRFPQVWELTAEAGYDLSRDLIPVAPAAHYMIGGVRVDMHGRTSVPGLYASGECAASGLHGANRLASNSLLEGLVFSERIACVLHEDAHKLVPGRIVSGAAEPSALVAIDRAQSTLQSIMADWVGVARSEGSLREAADILGGMARILEAQLSRPFELEMQNMVTLATLIAHAAWVRTETRGTHGREDHPSRDDARWRVHTVWRRGASPRAVPVGRV